MKKIYSFLGDFYHSHDFVYPAVKKAVDSMSGVELTDCTIADISQVIDKNPDVIILAAENRVNPQDENINLWLTPELDEKIASYVKNGGSFVAVHAALASYPEDSKYIDMLKGYFVSHPQEHYLVRFKSNEKLPFGGEPFDYEVMDEFYVLNVDEANTNVYMTSASEYGEGYGGWYHNYGDGKVIVIVPTHNKEGFEHPETVRLFNEGITWALGR